MTHIRHDPADVERRLGRAILALLTLLALLGFAWLGSSGYPTADRAQSREHRTEREGRCAKATTTTTPEGSATTWPTTSTSSYPTTSTTATAPPSSSTTTSPASTSTTTSTTTTPSSSTSSTSVPVPTSSSSSTTTAPPGNTLSVTVDCVGLTITNVGTTSHQVRVQVADGAAERTLAPTETWQLDFDSPNLAWAVWEDQILAVSGVSEQCPPTPTTTLPTVPPSQPPGSVPTPSTDSPPSTPDDGLTETTLGRPRLVVHDDPIVEITESTIAAVPADRLPFTGVDAAQMAATAAASLGLGGLGLVAARKGRRT